eukprot:TRINITY_DN33349_c0_g1_i1.p1 TRINITY_DN33349_c0_g1~~TRINITY_DN33349_c0_g1_i1.p1  ORF type:complete len:607 (-),score=154.37 TRINITY_DN33349_c0_g1_i1:29-1849(-)
MGKKEDAAAAEAEEARRLAEAAEKAAADAQAAKEAAEVAARLAAEEETARLAKEAEDRVIPDLVECMRTAPPVDTIRAGLALAEHLADAPEDAALRMERAGGLPVLVTLVKIGQPGQQEIAAKLLGTIASVNKFRQAAAAKAGTLVGLIKLASVGNKENKEVAARSLKLVVAGSEANQTSAVMQGCLKPLIDLAKRGVVHQKDAAKDALCQLGDKHPQNQIKISGFEGVDWIADIVCKTAGSASAAFNSKVAFAMLISTPANIKNLVELGETGTEAQAGVALRALNELLTSCPKDIVTKMSNQAEVGRWAGFMVLNGLTRVDNLMLRETAAKVLGNAVDGHHNNKTLAGKEGSIAAMSELMKKGTTKQKVFALQAIGHLCAGHFDNQTEVFEAGGANYIVELLRFGRMEEKAAASFALAELVAGRPEYQTRAATLGIIPVLVDVLGGRLPLSSSAMSRAPAALEKVARALGNVCAGHIENQKEAFSVSGVPVLTELIRGGVYGQKAAAAYALGSLSDNHHDAQKQSAKVLGVTSLRTLHRSGSLEERSAAALALTKTKRGKTALDASLPCSRTASPVMSRTMPILRDTLGSSLRRSASAVLTRGVT